MSNLVDIGDVPALDVWGDTVQARVIAGANASLAVVELQPEAIVPELAERMRRPLVRELLLRRGHVDEATARPHR